MAGRYVGVCNSDSLSEEEINVAIKNVSKELKELLEVNSNLSNKIMNIISKQ